MKPRVFVSSTFYDLKYIREDLAGFIRVHDFEPIMFEEGDIGYESGKPLDESCYETMRNADMAILIIGGQYGSNATKQETDKTDEFISITQKEFKSAVDFGIPVFAFIDTKVNAEYAVYKNNAEIIKEYDNNFKFNNTKDIRVFKFIQSVYAIGNIPVNEFIKITDIKEFLSKQWSDMFKKHLSMLKENKEIETIKSSISKLENLVNNMSLMLDAVGENVLKGDFKDIKNKQKAKEVCNNMIQVFEILDEHFINYEQRSNDLINMFLELKERFDRVKEAFDSLWPKDIEGMRRRIINECFNIALKYQFRIGINFNNIHFINEIYDALIDKNQKEEILKILSQEKYYDKIIYRK